MEEATKYASMHTRDPIVNILTTPKPKLIPSDGAIMLYGPGRRSRYRGLFPTNALQILVRGCVEIEVRRGGIWCQPRPNSIQIRPQNYRRFLYKSCLENSLSDSTNVSEAFGIRPAKC